MLGILSIFAERFRTITVTISSSDPIAHRTTVAEQNFPPSLDRGLQTSDTANENNMHEMLLNYHEIYNESYSSVLTAVINNVTAHFKSTKMKNT